MPRVSVVIPTYNHEKYVAEAIQSVLDQTYQDFEIVITNDGSTDRTVEVISKFTDPRIKLLSFEKNRGFIAADNNCIRNSSGEFVAELSSDDMFLPRKLEEQVNFLDEHPDIAAVFGYPYLIDEDGNDFTDVTSYYYHVFNQPNRTRHEWLHYFFYRGNGLAHPSALIRRDCLEDIGYGDERLVQLPDLDMWIRLCMKHSIYILPEKVFKFRIRQGEANLSGNRAETRIRDVWEHEQVLKHFLHVGSVDELCKIFPQMEEKRETIDEDLIPFFIATLALEVDSIVHRRFAIGVLFDLIGDRKTAQKIEQKYGFVYRDLIEITGHTDIYNYRTITSQQREIESMKTTEGQRSAEIEDLKSQVGQRSAEIEDLKSQVGQRSAEIEGLKAEVGQQRAEKHRLKKIAEKQNIEKARLKEIAEKQRSDITRLKETAEKQRSDITRLREIENSLSWRTIRKFLDIVDRLFRSRDVTQSSTVIDIAEEFENIEYAIPEEERVSTPPIYFCCDRAEILFDTLEVSGWAIASQGIDKVEIFCDDELLGKARYGSLRPDVEKVYPFIKNSDESGFLFRGKFEKSSNDRNIPITIRVTDCNGQSTEVEHVIDLIDRDDSYLLKTIPTEGTLRWMRKISEKFFMKPYISIYISIEDNSYSLLRGSLDSILNQSYPHWDIALICKNELPEDILQDLAPLIKEDKVKLYKSNRADESFKTIKGDFLGFINAGDLLAPHALFEIVKSINTHPNMDLLYTDEDSLINGQRKDFFFKPDWSPDLLLSMNYIGQFFLIKKDLFKNAGGVCFFSSEGFHDLLLRAAEHTQDIGHVPLALYTKGVPKEYSISEGIRVLEETLARRGIRGEVIPLDFPGTYRTKREILGNPMVSIIIPTAYKNPKMLSRCLHSIAEFSTYRNYEIILIDNSHGKLALKEIVQGISQDTAIQTMLYEDEFNFSRMNNLAASQAKGEYLIFLNDDTEVISPRWIEGMLEHAQRPEVGVTGVKLLYPDRTIQHAGMFLVDSGGGARHAFRHIDEKQHVYHNFPGITRNCSAVTFACVMISKGKFSVLGGFDEKLKVECNDVDFCLRAIQEGYLIVWTPFSVLYHRELVTREKFDFVDDTTYFWKRWRCLLEKGDPYYNPNLTLDSDNFFLNIRPVFIEHHEPYLTSDIKTYLAHNTDIDPATIRKILVVKLDHIGDVILGLPAIKKLRSKFPEAHITMLVGSWARPVVENISEIDDILVFNLFDVISEKGPRGLEHEEREKLKNTLHSLHFDLAVDLRRHHETREILKMTGARYTVGYSTRENDDWLSVSLKTTPDIEDIYAQPSKEHILAQFCHLIDAIPSSALQAVAFDASMPVFSFKNKIDMDKELSYVFGHEFVVGIHPFVGSTIRQWPVEYYIRLIDLLTERHNARVILFGGRGDERAAEDICLRAGHKEMVKSLAGKLSLEAFMQLVGLCHLFVGNISGPCHIAAAMQVPVVSIFGGTVLPHEWNPIGQNTMSVRLGLLCSPCYKAKPEQCPYNLKCLISLWPEKVFDAARQLMAISGISG